MRKKSKYLSNLAVWTPTSQQKVCSDGSEKFLPQRKPSRKKPMYDGLHTWKMLWQLWFRQQAHGRNQFLVLQHGWVIERNCWSLYLSLPGTKSWEFSFRFSTKPIIQWGNMASTCDNNVSAYLFLCFSVSRVAISDLESEIWSGAHTLQI